MTKSPNMSLPTFPAIATLRPRIRRATATFAAQPPTLVTKRDVVVSSPSPGSLGIGLAKRSATRMPTHATSIVEPSEHAVHGLQNSLDRRNVEVLHHRRERHRRIGRGHPTDGTFQAADAVFRH